MSGLRFGLSVRGGAALFSITLIAAGLGVAAAPSEASSSAAPPVASACQTLPGGRPEVTSFSLTPNHVNVMAGPKKITFTVKAQERTRSISQVIVEAQATAHPEHQVGVSVLLKLVAGSRTDGTWRGSATIPHWTLSGTWKVAWITVFDIAGGEERYAPNSEIGTIPPFAKSWPQSFQVSHAVSDFVPPHLSTISFTPKSVDTTRSTKRIHFQVTATDDRSGVGQVIITAGAIGDGSSWATATATLHLTSGTPRHGTWSGTMTLPRWLGGGRTTWAVNHVIVFDRAGQAREVSGGALELKNQPTTFLVTSRLDRTHPQLLGFTFSQASVDATSHWQIVTVTARATDTHSGVADINVTLTSPDTVFSTSAVLHLEKGSAQKGTWVGRLVIHRCGSSGTWTANVGVSDARSNHIGGSPTWLEDRHFAYQLRVKQLQGEG